MPVFKCKMCGGNLSISEETRVVTCEYCGTNQTIPRMDDEKITALFNRANRLRIDCEFDKASGIYESIVAEFPDESEAFWGLCLCEYGIEYVDDPKTAQKVPTCHRTEPSSIFDNENYLKALELADYASKKLYEEEAKEIDNIQKNILNIVSNEKPYDVFICYKETDDETGKRTEDSSIAQDIYTELTSEGYRVSFARATLRSVAGQEYEPYIYSALSSAKMMIVVGTKPEYLDAVWVKNEWSRYLNMMHSEKGKQFIPCYQDMDAYDLPKEFKNMQALNISDVTFFHNLISIIKKSISKEGNDVVAQPLNVEHKINQQKSSTKTLKEHKKLITISSITAFLLVVLSVILIPIFKKLPEYNAAKELLSTGKYAEATWAFEELDGFLKSEKLKKSAELSWRNSLSSIAIQSYMGGGTGASYSSYYIDENGEVNNFSHDEGDDHFTVTKQGTGKISSLASGYTIYALTEKGEVINADQNNLVKDPLEWQNIVQILPALNNTNIALRADGKVVTGKESGNAHNLLDEALKWKNIVKLDCDFDRITAGEVVGAILVGIDYEGNVLVDTYSENKDIDGLDTLKNLTDIIDIDVKFSVSELEFVALTNYGSVVSYIDGNFNEIDAPEVIDVELTLWEDTTYCTLDSKGNLSIKNKDKLMSNVIYINDGFFVTTNGSIFILEGIGDSPISDFVKVTEGTTKLLEEWLIKTELEIVDVEHQTQIKTKYLTFDLPVFWKGNWEIEETNDLSFTIYEKEGFNNNRQGDLVSILLSDEKDFDAPSYDKLGDITIDNKQYSVYAVYPTDVSYENDIPIIYSKMSESLESIMGTIKSSGEYKLTLYDRLKEQYKIGKFSSDAAELNITSNGDEYIISFDIWRLTGIEGIGINDGEDIIFNGIDASGGDMTMRITYKGSTATLTIVDSTWDYLPNGEQFVLEKEDSYY